MVVVGRVVVVVGRVVVVVARVVVVVVVGIVVTAKAFVFYNEILVSIKIITTIRIEESKTTQQSRYK